MNEPSLIDQLSALKFEGDLAWTTQAFNVGIDKAIEIVRQHEVERCDPKCGKQYDDLTYWGSDKCANKLRPTGYSEHDIAELKKDVAMFAREAEEWKKKAWQLALDRPQASGYSVKEDSERK